jgi:hypothetical protein
MLAAQNNSIQFFQNAIDWGATDSVLTSIRSRPVQTSRLNIVSGRIRLWVRASALLAPTILLLVFGWFIRRKIYQR